MFSDTFSLASSPGRAPVDSNRSNSSSLRLWRKVATNLIVSLLLVQEMHATRTCDICAIASHNAFLCLRPIGCLGSRVSEGGRIWYWTSTVIFRSRRFNTFLSISCTRCWAEVPIRCVFIRMLFWIHRRNSTQHETIARTLLLLRARAVGWCCFRSLARCWINSWKCSSSNSQKSIFIVQQYCIMCIILEVMALRLPPSSRTEAPRRNL